MKTLPLLVCFVVLFSPLCASAEYIQLTTTVDTIEIAPDGSAKTVVIVKNTGDEAAHAVEVSARLAENFTASPIRFGIIEPGKEVSDSLQVSYAGSKPGTFPASLLVDYADAQGYRFSAVVPFFVFVGENPGVSQVSATGKAVTISKGSTGTLEFMVRNTDTKLHKVTAQLVLPRELAADDGREIIELEPTSAKNVTFRIKEIGALSGSNYVVALHVRYEEGERSFGSNSTVEVAIKEPPSLYIYATFLAIGGALLFAFFSLVRRKRSKA